MPEIYTYIHFFLQKFLSQFKFIFRMKLVLNMEDTRDMTLFQHCYVSTWHQNDTYLYLIVMFDMARRCCFISIY